MMVVKSKGRLILLDTGMGIFASPVQGWLLTGLAETGFKASDFTDVILSHGHPDHIGGLVDKQSNLVFTNADLLWLKWKLIFGNRQLLKILKTVLYTKCRILYNKPFPVFKVL